jgi:hypothetical protein
MPFETRYVTRVTNLPGRNYIDDDEFLEFVETHKIMPQWIELDRNDLDETTGSAVLSFIDINDAIEAEKKLNNLDNPWYGLKLSAYFDRQMQNQKERENPDRVTIKLSDMPFDMKFDEFMELFNKGPTVL